MGVTRPFTALFASSAALALAVSGLFAAPAAAAQTVTPTWGAVTGITHTLDLKPTVPASYTLQLSPGTGVGLTTAVFSNEAGGTVGQLTDNGDGSWNLPLTGLPLGVWTVTVGGSDGTVTHTYSFDVDVTAAGGPDILGVDLAGAGDTVNYLDYEPQTFVRNPRRDTVTFVAPEGYTFTGAAFDTALELPEIPLGSGSGVQTTVAGDGSSFDLYIPRRLTGGPVIAQDAGFRVEVSMPTGDREATVGTVWVMSTAAAKEPIPQSVVIGTNGALYARAHRATSYRNLGGVLVGAPVVMQTSDGENLYLGQSPNNGLYVRTDTLGWQRLNLPKDVCLDPDAVLDGGDLVIGCRGGNGKLYLARVAYVPGTLPFVSSWTGRGGLISGGPGVAVDPLTGDATFVVTGGSYGAGNVYATDESMPAGSFRRVPMTCAASPALEIATDLYDESLVDTFIACAGTGQALMVYQGVGEDYRVDSFGGRITGRPGLQASWFGEARATVVGVNNGIYEISINGNGSWYFERQPGTGLTGSGAGATGLVGQEIAQVS